MRVTLIVERFEPSGGVESVVWRVAHGLRDAGDRVRVLARTGTDVPGVALERLPVPEAWQPVRVASFALRAGRAVRRGPPADVVHSFCRSLRQDVFHAGGGSHADSMRHTYGPVGAAWRRASPRHAVQLALERRIFADPHPVVQCVSSMVAREIATRYAVAPDRLAVIHNGVDAVRFGSVSDRDAASLRRELGADRAAAWLFAGSGWRRKGLDTALRALAACRDRTLRLWVAGGDPPARWARRAARLGVAERVRFLGPRADMERLLAAADGLLLPTRYDAFGLVCLEAAAAGRPVVTSARAGAAELLEGAGAVVSDPDDAAAFARALDRLADPAERERCGETGRKRAEGLDWPHQIEALRALYGRVARR